MLKKLCLRVGIFHVKIPNIISSVPLVALTWFSDEPREQGYFGYSIQTYLAHKWNIAALMSNQTNQLYLFHRIKI